MIIETRALEAQVSLIMHRKVAREANILLAHFFNFLKIKLLQRSMDLFRF
jgi:hypothetical protein